MRPAAALELGLCPWGLLLISQEITDLVQTRTMLVQADRQASLGRLVAGLMHEMGSARQASDRIQTTLGSLRSFAQLDEAEVQTYQLTDGLNSVTELLARELESVVVE